MLSVLKREKNFIKIYYQSVSLTSHLIVRVDFFHGVTSAYIGLFMYNNNHISNNLCLSFLKIIVYILFQSSAYITEVHHVNGEGEDAGVVYCEMQARENTGESRTYLSMLRAMYPGHCGYKSETGGMLGNLRTSTSHKKVNMIRCKANANTTDIES